MTPWRVTSPRVSSACTVVVGRVGGAGDGENQSSPRGLLAGFMGFRRSHSACVSVHLRQKQQVKRISALGA